MEQPTENWKPIPGWEGLYEVSDLGRVRSLDRRVRAATNGYATKRGKVLKPTVDSTGYLVLNLSRDSRPKRYHVHSLVLMTFVGPRPDRMEACHGVGGPRDNRLLNLRWDTSSANNRDIVAHGNNRNKQKTHCPQGHEYAHPNLVPGDFKNGIRRCKACTQARSYAHVMNVPFTQQLADSYYDRLRLSS